MAGPGRRLDALPDSCLSAVLSNLEARDVLSVRAVDRRCRRISQEDEVWRALLATSFPFHSRGLAAGASAEAAYRRLHGVERRWHTAPTPCRTYTRHSGPVFGCRLLAPPFPPGLLVSAATGLHDTPESLLWRLGPGSSQPLPLGDLTGLFSVTQRPGTHQLGYTTFDGHAAIVQLRPQPLDDIDAWDAGQLELAAHTLGLLGPDAPLPPQQALRELVLSVGPLWEARRVVDLKAHAGPCPLVAFQEPGGLAVSVSYDCTIQVFRLPAEEELPEPQPSAAEGVAGGPAAAADAPGAVGAGGVGEDDSHSAALEPTAVLRDGDAPPSAERGVCVALLPVGDAAPGRLLTGGNDMQIKLWDLERRSLVQRLTGHSGWVWNLERLDDACDCIVSAATDGVVRLWDVRAGGEQQGSCLLRVEGDSGSGAPLGGAEPGNSPCGPVAGTALRPDGRLLIAGAFDRRAYIVDLRMLRVLRTLCGHEDRLTRVAAADDLCVTASFDSTLRLWDFRG